MKSHDFAFRVDRLDLGLLDIAVPVGHVNRREDAIDQATVASDCHGLRTAPLLAPSGMRPPCPTNEYKEFNYNCIMFSRQVSAFQLITRVSIELRV